MEAFLIAVVGLMLAARPLARGGRRGETEPLPARIPHRHPPDPGRERGREDDLHRRRVDWLRADLARAVGNGDAETARRLRALVRAERARHRIRIERLTD
jgi:hypothetical protein